MSGYALSLHFCLNVVTIFPIKKKKVEKVQYKHIGNTIKTKVIYIYKNTDWKGICRHGNKV